MRKQRGFSVAEVLTVTVICGMLLAAMVVIVPILLKSPAQMQAQVDDVNTAAIALYKIRRDFSQGDPKGVFGCTLQPIVICQSYSSLTSVPALAVATADDGTGQFKVDPNTGYPKWQGVVVYWLVPNSTGTAFDLMRAEITSPTGGVQNIGSGPNGIPLLTADNAQLAVTAAMLISPPPVLANYILGMQMGTNNATSTVSFSLNAGTNSGSNQTSTNFASDTYARN